MLTHTDDEKRGMWGKIFARFKRHEEIINCMLRSHERSLWFSWDWAWRDEASKDSPSTELYFLLLNYIEYLSPSFSTQALILFKLFQSFFFPRLPRKPHHNRILTSAMKMVSEAKNVPSKVNMYEIPIFMVFMNLPYLSPHPSHLQSLPPPSWWEKISIPMKSEGSDDFPSELLFIFGFFFTKIKSCFPGTRTSLTQHQCQHHRTSSEQFLLENGFYQSKNKHFIVQCNNKREML